MPRLVTSRMQELLAKACDGALPVAVRIPGKTIVGAVTGDDGPMFTQFEITAFDWLPHGFTGQHRERAQLAKWSTVVELGAVQAISIGSVPFTRYERKRHMVAQLQLLKGEI